MSKDWCYAAGLSAVCLGIPLLWISPVWACIFIFVGILFLTRAFTMDDTEPYIRLGIPQVSALEREQLRQLKQDSEIKALAQIILLWAENEKKRHMSTMLYFPDEQLRFVLGKDGDRLHAVMNYLVSEGRAKRASLPGYWEIS